MQSGRDPNFDALIDRVIADKFRIRRCVGLGASGAVFQADQIALGRTVAVKFIKPELAEDPRIVSRFQDEALAASRLNHPNTVSIIDYGQTPDGLLYLVMEFLRGKTLTQLIQRDFPLSPERVANIVTQILSGLEEAHAVGVIHADLKADNIIVERRRGDWELAKVVDFGVARIVGVTHNDESDNTICGTPEYMAPELITGADPTAASDIYAVGVILYELLTGATPFGDSQRIVDILTRQFKEAPAPPSSKRPDMLIDGALEELAMSALAKKPEDRFANATEFRRALERSVAPVLGGSGDHVICGACGASGATSFKFCPECGTPRADGGDGAVIDLEPPTPTADSSAGGLFPLPFVGRGSELETLQAFANGAGNASLMQVVAPPGGGRSRLVREVCNRIGGEVVSYVTNADPTGLASPFYPVRAVVAAVLELPPVCTYEQLEASLEHHGLSRRDLPGIGELFGHEGELWQLEPPVRRRELLASTTRVLRAAGERGRALIVFEDVELYDNPSQELLRRLGETTTGGDAIRVLVTNGPQFAERWDPRVVRLDLAPLDETAAIALVSHAADLGKAAVIEPSLLIELTGGNPGTVTELLRYVSDGGSMADPPNSAADLVAARLRLLPRQARSVCQAAAVFGTEVDRALLESMLAKHMPADAIDEAIAVLVEHGVLVDEAPVYAFRSRLVRDVAYDATPADVRRSLHASAAASLASEVADTAVLGHHHELAGNLTDAADLLGHAGDIAVHSFDDVGASRLYQRGLAAARRLMLASDDEENRIRFVTLSVKLADSLRVGGEVGLARGIVEEAKGYCQDAPALASQLLRASAHLSITEGRTSAAVDSIRRAIGQTIPTGRVDLLCELYLDMSSMLLRDARSSIASSELEEAIDLVTLGEGAHANSGPHTLWRLLLRLAQLYVAVDRRKKALYYGEAALKHARRVRSNVGAARVQSMLALYYERAGDLERAETYRQAAVDEMRRLGDRRGTAELLLQGVRPTRTIQRISPESLEEARVLAQEVGWEEGIARAAGGDGE